jgi:hypothetical protein
VPLALPVAFFVAGADLQSVPLVMPVAFFVAGADLQSVPLVLLGYNPKLMYCSVGIRATCVDQCETNLFWHGLQIRASDQYKWRGLQIRASDQYEWHGLQIRASYQYKWHGL